MKTLRAGVVGVGKLGRFHCDKYRASAQDFEGLKLVGVYDLFQEHCMAVATELSQQSSDQVLAFSSLDELASRVDVVTVATTSQSHFEIVKFFLNRGIHVLVEKPLALGFEQGQELVSLAKERGIVLAVGHSERFNPVYKYLKAHLEGNIRSAQFMRHSPFVPRVTDVSVVDDLMIHDLDLLADLLGDKFEVASAFGYKLRSSHFDFCEAHLIAPEKGIQVSLSAQRLMPTMTRTIRVITDKMTLIIDLQSNQLDLCRWDSTAGGAYINESVIQLPKQDHLLLETREFLKQITFGTSEYCSGLSVLPALKWRDSILAQC